LEIKWEVIVFEDFIVALLYGVIEQDMGSLLSLMHPFQRAEQDRGARPSYPEKAIEKLPCSNAHGYHF
jgi:hypothetical protein